MQFATGLLFLAGSWLSAGAQWLPEPQLHYVSPVDPRARPAYQSDQQQQQFQQKLVEEHPALSWRYPEPPPEEPRNLAPDFTLRQPATPQSVRVECGEQLVQVQVQKDLMGTRQLIRGSDILLGDCPPSEEQLEVLVFQYPLDRCGSQLRASI